MQPSNQIRPPAVAGQFYPDSPERLQSTVAQCLGAAPVNMPDNSGSILAVVAPHAGYQYSGAVAGRAYAALQRRPDSARFSRAVVMAPAHRIPFRGLALGDYAAFATPLGNVPVDLDACAALAAASPLIKCRRDAHAREHALEVQLPFLQTVLPDCRLIPVVCGELDACEVRAVAATLAGQLDDGATLWIASTDFTHFGAAFGYEPFVRDVPARLAELDLGAVNLLERLDWEGFLEYVDKTGATICGRLPLAVLAAIFAPRRERVSCRLLEYTTSGRLTGDFSHSVSYAAMLIRETATAAPPDPPALSRDECLTLLRLARQAIADSANKRPDTALEAQAAGIPAALLEPAAVFVSLLDRNGGLRGCLGTVEPRLPLFAEVMENAVAAASHDSRFPPVTPEELSEISIEISVLGRPVPGTAAEFDPARHGIIMDVDGRRGLFLPRVAAEHGWDRETALAQLCRKAGCKDNAWRKPGARLQVFTAMVIRENPGLCASKQPAS